MVLLVAALGVFSGVAYAGLANRSLGRWDWRRWLVLVTPWAIYIVLLFTADMSDTAPRVIQSFAIGSFLETALDLLRALRDRRAATPNERVALAKVNQQ